MLSADAVTTGKISNGTILNEDIDAAAAIDYSKLASLASANILVGSAGNVATSTAVTGDVTISNAGVTTIGALKVVNGMLSADAVTNVKILNSNVTYAKIQDVSATDKVLGRISAGAGVVEEISTTGSGSVVRENTPTLTTPNIGAATATSINGNTITTGTGTLTIGAGKTFTSNNTLTLAGTDGTTMTFPTSTATIARTDAAQTFSGTQTFSGLISGSLGLDVTGAVVNINNDATANGVNIGTSTNTGIVTIGGTGNQTISIGNGAAVKTVNLGSTNTTSTTNIEAGTSGLNLGTAAIAKTTNIGTGNAVQTINIGNNATPANLISIGGAASNVLIGGGFNYGGTSGGAANTQTITLSPAPTALTPGLVVVFIAGFSTTANPTLDVNGLGAIPLYKSDDGTAVANEIISGSLYMAIYSGANFYVIR